ncbi:XRE family transcriptional regulator [Caulobacter sp. 17J65-9]|uniref:helix-turn-helix domain-containing protein n=1 Tax=Caulobacter sp. 17J65-9 TaxID=2709382 RepID=UPI0013C6F06C|nr:XRE family transcriptional regulator [Caulobacter sp. 17J65-9]NEX95263.1 helix-turn-helix transcriptional regulator [Caulobacter sp. 17J65-9]
MDTIVDEAGARLSRRIRLERGARDWSLAELAQRSGVSKAMISKIERGETSPTATVLVRLAVAFDLTLAGLLVRAEADADGGLLSRAADQPVWRDPATGYLRRQVFARPDHPVELVRVELPAGARVTLPASSYARIRPVVWLIEGELTITEGEARRTLRDGDALAFGQPADTTYTNETDRPCTYLVTLSRS